MFDMYLLKPCYCGKKINGGVPDTPSAVASSFYLTKPWNKKACCWCI